MQVPSTTRTAAARLCPRCGGPLYHDYDTEGDALLCLLCGEYILTPDRRRFSGWRWRNGAARVGE
jgi:hypothetical protein